MHSRKKRQRSARFPPRATPLRKRRRTARFVLQSMGYLHSHSTEMLIMKKLLRTTMWRGLYFIFVLGGSLLFQLSAAGSVPDFGAKLSPLETVSIPAEASLVNGATFHAFQGSFGSHSKRPRRSFGSRLRLAPKKCVEALTNPKVISAVQVGLVAYLLFGIIKAAKDVYQEMLDDSDDYGVASSNAVLSANSARKLVLWLEQEPEERGDPPPVSPSWMVGLAHDLHSCHALSVRELYRILANLTKSQATLLQSSLLKSSKKPSFENIGGLSAVKASVQDWITSTCNIDNRLPSQQTPFDQFVSQGRQGLILWGPPGCGKSMILEAIANKSGWPTLVVTPSSLQRKWFGESTNQVRTLFGLVSLLGRCTVVLDELDGLFRVRDSNEHEVSRELKTEWLQWWDGAASSNLRSQSKVVVVGATNRPWDIDPAVWRRLPQRFYVGVPTWDDRCDLVHKIVEAYKLPAIHPMVIEYLAEATEGYTASDLFQILQGACRKGPMARMETDLTMEDVQHALNEIPPTRFSSQYIHQLQDFLGVPSQPTQQRPSEASHGYDKPGFWQINVPVDAEVFDLMEDYVWKHHEWESSDHDSQYEEESEEEEDDL